MTVVSTVHRIPSLSNLLEIFSKPLPVVTSVPHCLEESGLEATHIVKSRQEVVPKLRRLDHRIFSIWQLQTV